MGLLRIVHIKFIHYCRHSLAFLLLLFLASLIILHLFTPHWLSAQRFHTVVTNNAARWRVAVSKHLSAGSRATLADNTSFQLLDLQNVSYRHVSDVCATYMPKTAASAIYTPATAASATYTNEPISILFVVISNPRTRALRSAYRAAAPSAWLRRFAAARVFVFGTVYTESGGGGGGGAGGGYFSSINTTVADQIAAEMLEYGDLVQGDFVDSYHNMTYIHSLGLHFAVTRCQNIRYVVKQDDDTAVDWYRLLRMINSLSDSVGETDVSSDGPHTSTSSLLVGIPFRGSPPVRDASHKWFISRDEYAEEVYPDFLSGWLYVTTPLVAALLVSEAGNMTRIWIDDVFLLGIVRQQLGLEYTSFEREMIATNSLCLSQCLANQTISQDVLTLALSGNPEVAGSTVYHTCDVIIGPSLHNAQLLHAFMSLATLCSANPQRCQSSITNEPNSLCVNQFY